MKSKLIISSCLIFPSSIFISTFKLLPHEENGYEDGGWKNQTTRYNQLRYHNEVLTNSVNFKDDGISTCTFREYGKNTVDNIIQVNVGI